MQQINLYQPILRKQERVFSIKTLLKGNLFILAVLMLFYATSLYQSYSLNQNIEQLNQERVKHAQSLTEMRNKFPPQKEDPALTETIKEKQALLTHRQRLIRELRHQNTGTGGNPGFSEQLSGLSRQHVRNIWFEQISVRDNKQLTLQGKATTASEVPKLIQRLTKEPSFSGTTFSSVNISRDESNSALIDFVLQTESEDGKKKGNSR